MIGSLVLVFVLTFVVNLITTLFFAVRVAGARTGRLSSAVALFNVVVLLMRFSTSLQALLLAKHIESTLHRGGDELSFRVLLLAATAGSLAGALLIPTAQRLISDAVGGLGVHRSLPRLLRFGLPLLRLSHVRSALRFPSTANLTGLRNVRELPLGVGALYTFATALLTVGLFSSLYAGYYNPQYRMTANNMSLLINGAATVIVLLFTDPFLGVITDDAIAGTMSQEVFRRNITVFVIAQIVGTVVAQILLIPAARLIAWVAGSI
jgi:lysylphosphatidylglycerol synthetase-like protein (DUF2156 family)